MKAVLVVCLTLLLGASSCGNASTKKNPRSSIWGSIRRNAADIEKLTAAINDNANTNTVDMEKLTRAINDNANAIENLQKMTSEGDLYFPLHSKLFTIINCWHSKSSFLKPI